jgi:acyl-CoA dehydrogenase
VKKPDDALAGATPYLRLFGLAAGGAYLAEAALASRPAAKDSAAAARISTARFFAENIAPAASGLERAVVAGADSVLGSDAALTN